MASSLREEEWQQHFYTIRRLWSIDLLSLDVVMKRMEQLGFYASKPDYRAKLQAWGFKQNQPSEAWKYIEHQTKKRKRDKKESDVIISGIRQLPKKWKRETSRHFYATTELNSTETPNSPPGSLITVCTPTATNLEFCWPPGLPFLRFCKQAEGIQPNLHRILQDKVRGLNETQSLHNFYQSPVKLLREIGMSAVSNVISNASNVNQVATSLGSSGEDFKAAIESLAMDIISWVLSRGVSPDLPISVGGESHHPLSIIARGSDVNLDAALSCAEILLANGALAQTFCCAFHDTPINYAVSHCSPLFVDALLRSTPPRAILQSSEDMADIIFKALHHYDEDMRFDIIRRLMCLGMESGLAAKDTMSRLMEPEGLLNVIRANDLRLLGYLHDNGAIWDCHDYEAYTNYNYPESPLQRALHKMDERILLLLLHNGAVLRGDELLIATRFDGVALGIIDALVAAGVDLCLQDLHGKTALYLSVEADRLDISRTLVHAGAPWDDQVLNKAMNQGYDSEEFESFLKESRESRDISNIYTIYDKLPESYFNMCEDTAEATIKELLAKKLWPQYAAIELVLEVFRVHICDLVSLVLARFPTVWDLELIEESGIWCCWPKLDDECRNIFRGVWKRATLSSLDIEGCFSIVGCTASLAASDGNFELIDFLLAHSPNELSLRTDDFSSPFFQLVQHLGGAGNDAMAGHLGQVIEKLLSAGYTITPFAGMEAIWAGCSLQTIRDLVKFGFNPCLRYADYPTALQCAVATRSSDVIRHFLEAGCDLNAPPMCKPTSSWHDHPLYRTALQLAVENSDIDAINMLLEAGADVNAPPAPYRGATALQLSAINGSIGISMKLISLGADINADGCEEHGRTALEGAAEHGRLDTVQLLFEKGCNLEGAGRRQYVRALFFAKREGHHVLASHLQNLGGWTLEDEQLTLKERKIYEKEALWLEDDSDSD
ncbi:putative Clr5 domain-containing protein [Seiridium unicorne]|uniref:Clr5 domain-containing protein n=1 Tax=Seiridium unicorne TaxID=138068 RepID=A0ABR2VDL8_9PEZI